MRARTVLSLFIPAAAAALFISLGLWQVDRGRERAAANAGLGARLEAQPVPFTLLPADTALVRLMPVSLAGRFRYDLEQVEAGRTNRGSPGVHLLTPLEREGSDTLVLVVRGWVYSPNAAGVDLARWRETDLVELTGYAMPLPDSGPPAPLADSVPLRSLNRAALESRVGAPLAGAYIVMTSDSTARIDSVPRRLPPPVISAGPHRSYAIQWFSFAAIALVGGYALFRRSIVVPRTGA